MQTIQSYHLKLLADEDCWELFSRLAFGNNRLGSSDPQQEAIGKQIAKQCNGLPLAAKTIASYLSQKPNFEEWYAVSKNLSHYTADVLPVLKLSYDSLPSHLKRCFAYCSIFPKAYEFEMEQLVLLWMAEDLLQPPRGNKRLEDIGHEYFNELISRSFFQQSDHNKSRFVMHALMNDLAKSVSRDLCVRLEDSITLHIPDKVRHLSFSGSKCDAAGVFISIRRAKFLRTILPFGMVPDLESLRLTESLLHDMLLGHRYLRVLCLSNYHIKKLPDAVENLKHLRYLDISCTAIKSLPDSVCTLCNLQTLLLSNCRSLTRLPTNMGRLISLRYLDLVGTPLKEMPVGMSRLRSLSMLSNFVTGRLRGAGLHELNTLSYLRGTLHISELQNVAFATEASEASLKKKQYLDKLVLRWTDKAPTFFPGRIHTISCDQTRVLETIEPHPNLKSLSIEFYGGSAFPNWLGDSSFSHLASVQLRSCNFCLSLPPLGQLPSLKDLIIENLDRVQSIGHEFFCAGSDLAVNPFQSLQTLKFYGMPRWEEWVSPEIEGCAFPCLQKLHIQNCPVLTRCFPINLPSFAEVIISDCPLELRVTHDELQRNKVPTQLSRDSSSSAGAEAVVALAKSSFIQNLERPSSSEPTRLDKEPPFPNDKSNSATEDESLPRSSGDTSAESNRSDSFRQGVLNPEISGKRKNKVQDEINFESMKVSEITELMELPPGLHRLKIEGCNGLNVLPEGLTRSNPCLRDLFIIGCSTLQSFSGGHPPISLKTLYVRDCRNLVFVRTVRTMHQYSELEHLFIGSSCGSLHSFPLAFFPKLKSLSIWDCANFSSITVPGGLLAEDHISVEALEIRDCPNFVSFTEGGLPAPKLASLLISNCKSLKALPERLSLLCSLKSLFIYECPELDKVPEGGFPLSLSTLCITHCHKLTPEKHWGISKLKKLHNLEIEGGCKGIESFPDENLLPRNLHSLRISEFPDLKDLNFKGFQNLKSLKSLEIASCDKLLSLPDVGLPPSLCYLYINDCPSIKAKLQEKGTGWYKLSRTPHAVIDGEAIHEITIKETRTDPGKGKPSRKISQGNNDTVGV